MGQQVRNDGGMEMVRNCQIQTIFETQGTREG